MTSETPKCETKPPEPPKGYDSWLDASVGIPSYGGVWGRAELAALRRQLADAITDRDKWKNRYDCLLDGH